MIENAWWRASSLSVMPTDPFAANPRVAHRDNRLEFCSLENAENTNPGLPVNPSPPSPNTDTNLIVTASRDSAESARPHASVAPAVRFEISSSAIAGWLPSVHVTTSASDTKPLQNNHITRSYWSLLAGNHWYIAYSDTLTHKTNTRD